MWILSAIKKNQQEWNDFCPNETQKNFSVVLSPAGRTTGMMRSLVWVKTQTHSCSSSPTPHSFNHCTDLHPWIKYISVTFAATELQAAAGPEPPEPAETLSPHHQQTPNLSGLSAARHKWNRKCFILSESEGKFWTERGRIRAGPLRDDPAVEVTAAQNWLPAAAAATCRPTGELLLRQPEVTETLLLPVSLWRRRNCVRLFICNTT